MGNASKCLTFLLLYGLTSGLSKAVAQDTLPTPLRGRAPTFKAIDAAHAKANDTTRALIHLFKRKNLTGKIFAYGSGALLVGGIALTSVIARNVSGNANPAPLAAPLLWRAWIIYGSTLTFGVIRTQLYSRRRLLTVLDAYQRTGTLPEKYRKKLRPKDFR